MPTDIETFLLHAIPWTSIPSWQSPSSKGYRGSTITQAERKKRTAEKKRAKKARKKNR